MKRKYVVGSRSSPLAQWQAEWVMAEVRKFHPGASFRLVTMNTRGDKFLDVSLAKIGGKGLFTKELEVALQSGEIDMAVHSMKDLPTSLPDGLEIGAMGKRELPWDALVAKRKLKLKELPPGARIGTSSLRRASQLLFYRPDFKIVQVRGNVATRLRKMEELNLDAMVMAFAGLKRLGLDGMVSEMIPGGICLPAVGQGAIGIEIRSGDEELRGILACLNDVPTWQAVTAERALMRKLEGGCQVPVGAYGEVKEGKLILDGMVAALSGRPLLRGKITGLPEEAVVVGESLAVRLSDLGADEILRKVRQEYDKDA